MGIGTAIRNIFNGNLFLDCNAIIKSEQVAREDLKNTRERNQKLSSENMNLKNEVAGLKVQVSDLESAKNDLQSNYDNRGAIIDEKVEAEIKASEKIAELTNKCEDLQRQLDAAPKRGAGGKFVASANADKKVKGKPKKVQSFQSAV